MKKQIIGITSGCFDLIHPLHIQYLNKCKRECDYLLVLLDSDQLICKHKPPPLFNEDDRKYIIEHLNMVDDVMIFNDLQEFIIIIEDVAKQHPVRVFKHAGNIYGQPTVKIKSTELVIISDVQRFSSSTEIKQFIKQKV